MTALVCKIKHTWNEAIWKTSGVQLTGWVLAVARAEAAGPACSLHTERPGFPAVRSHMIPLARSSPCQWKWDSAAPFSAYCLGLLLTLGRFKEAANSGNCKKSLKPRRVSVSQSPAWIFGKCQRVKPTVLVRVTKTHSSQSSCLKTIKIYFGLR